MATNNVEFLTQVVWLPRRALVIPKWAFKTDFVDDDERERFVQSVREGMTPLHIARISQRGRWEIVDGVHRIKALDALGVDAIPCYDHGVRTRAERKLLALRYAWAFAADTLPLAHAIADIQGALPEALALLPYDDVELERLLSTLEVDLETAPSSGDGYDEDDEDAGASAPRRKTKRVTCPHCGEEFEL